jgi:hypothetical protein
MAAAQARAAHAARLIRRGHRGRETAPEVS